MRAVLDPNILIAALLSPVGSPGQILSRWPAGEFELVVSDALLAELERALAYPKLRTRISASEAAEFVFLLEETAAFVADPDDPRRRSTDPGDDYLVALAEHARAVLVSGDRHLLDLARDLPIRSAAEFLASLAEH